MPRPDISKNLIHFTKGDDLDVAFSNLCSIVDSGSLRGSGNLVRGGYRCVCFSEAPIELLPNGLVNPSLYSRYSPFGILVTKGWLFRQGGRPVIYGPADDYDRLPENLRWRHVRYEPNSEPPIDFTWEREWRIRAELLDLEPQNCLVVVPDDSWVDALIQRHENQQDWEVYRYSIILGDDLAEMYRESFRWGIVTIEQNVQQ